MCVYFGLARARPLISHTIAARWLSGTSRCDGGGSFGTPFYRARLYHGKVARITVQTPRNGASGRCVSSGGANWGSHSGSTMKTFAEIMLALSGGIIRLNADSYFSPLCACFCIRDKGSE